MPEQAWNRPYPPGQVVCSQCGAPFHGLTPCPGSSPDVPAVPYGRDGAEPKYGGLDGAWLCVQVLREQADRITLWLDRGFERPGKPLKPMRRKILDAQLDATCTCIELLTQHGNYSAERSAALARVRGTKPE